MAILSFLFTLVPAVSAPKPTMRSWETLRQEERKGLNYWMALLIRATSQASVYITHAWRAEYSTLPEPMLKASDLDSEI